MRRNIDIVACMCVRNCQPYLPQVFANLDRLSERCHLRCIIIYDNCTDDSAELIERYRASRNYQIHAETIDNPSRLRTVRIAKARNRYLEILYGPFGGADYHICLDVDDINAGEWDLQVIDRCLADAEADGDDWDALSFNHRDKQSVYYDSWALTFDRLRYNWWAFGDHSWGVNHYIRRCMMDEFRQLEQSGRHSVRVCSAFNGFAIHKTRRFENIRYDGLWETLQPLISPEETQALLQHLKERVSPHLEIHPYTESCEHVYYYWTAARENGCIIKVSKYSVCEKTWI